MRAVSEMVTRWEAHMRHPFLSDAEVRARVLEALADGKWHRGTAVADQFDTIARSRAYVALAQLQRDNVVEAQWLEGDGRPYRTFRLKTAVPV